MAWDRAGPEIFRSMLDLHEGVFAFALNREYRYIGFNDAHAQVMQQLWGCPIQDGDSMLDHLRREDDRERAREHFGRALGGETFVVDEDYGDRLRRRYRVRYAPILDDADTITGLSVFCMDITDQARLEAAERRRSLHAERINSVGMLAGRMAHDFNNYLAVASTFVELMALEPDLAAGELDDFREATRRAAAMIRTVLNQAGNKPATPEVLGLNGVVRDVESMLRLTAGPRARLELSLDGGIPDVLLDRTAVEQSVINLVKNAVEAAPAGGVTIRISTEVVDLDAAGCCSDGARSEPTIRPGRYLCLAVKDDGPGLSIEEIGQVFDPFYTTKASGSGLGLSTVVGTARAHGGHACIRRLPEGGAGVALFLPVRSELPKLEALSASSRTESRVLVVDDDPATREVIGLLLDSAGLTHAGAANGEQALAELAADPSIEIVITDCRMPEMTGPELHGRIRAAGIPVSVVLMSAFPRDVVMDGRDDDDADLLFLEKPFTFLELHQVLAERLRTG